MRPLPGLRPVLFLFFFFLCSSLLYAQATAAASRKFSASAFAGLSFVDTGRPGSNNVGFTFGGGITGYLPLGFKPSLEGRIRFAPGSDVSENTFGGGIRIQHSIKRVDPYVDFLYSYGLLYLHNPLYPDYTRDNSAVYSPGGGADINLNYHWAARVDYQYEFWHVGLKTNFNPQVLTVGAVYRFR